MLLVTLILCSNSLFSQDLIQRTRNGSFVERNTSPNAIARELTSRLQGSAARNAAFDPFEIAPQVDGLTETFTSDAVYLELKESVINNLIEQQLPTLTLNIPVDQKQSFELELYRVDLYSEDFRMRTNDGAIIRDAPNKGLFYRGIVAGDKSSLVAVSIFDNFIRITIGDNEGNYIIGKTDNNSQHILYNDRSLLLPPPPGCENTDFLTITKDGFQADSEKSTSRSMMDKCVPIYVECDYQMYLDHGGHVVSVQNFVGSLVNETATLYTNEGISISLSDVLVWTTEDPYRDLNSTGEVLQRFGQLTQNNYNGRLAHFISTRNLGGGVAWVDVLCSEYFTFGNPVQYAGPYAVSANFGTSVNSFPTYSQDVLIFAHEMGHNFGSPHTQSCSWNGNNTAIDGCYPTEGSCPRPTPNCPPGGGTIMSYCHILSGCGIDFNNGFGDQPGTLIKSRYDNAACMLSCAAPTCDDGIMNGDETGIDCGGTDCTPCPCYNSPLTLQITFDQYPQETSWDIRNSSNAVLQSGGPYSNQSSGSSITVNNINIPDGEGYVFTMYDQFGDGICCSYGNGSFTISGSDGDLIADGGAYGSEISFTFCINSGDECPNDPNKTEPGECGCGVPETDSDNDGTPDCIDDCPDDPNKTIPKICGCGTPETDRDNDGTPDCVDACPDDPNKTRPMECGCGVVDQDSDGDKVLDCDDLCPNDPNKSMPGSCGCGVSDRDNNGAPNCFNDSCPENQSVTDNPASGTYNAEKVLMTDGEVNVTGTATFEGGESVILRPGFHAQVGSNFTAAIVVCNSALTPSAENDNKRSKIALTLNNPTAVGLKVVPNPFKQQSTIQFELNQATEVYIRLVNTNGQQIKLLANGIMANRGRNEIILNGATLEMGVYYVLLQTPYEVLSKKIILIQ